VAVNEPSPSGTPSLTDPTTDASYGYPSADQHSWYGEQHNGQQDWYDTTPYAAAADGTSYGAPAGAPADAYGQYGTYAAYDQTGYTGAWAATDTSWNTQATQTGFADDDPLFGALPGTADPQTTAFAAYDPAATATGYATAYDTGYTHAYATPEPATHGGYASGYGNTTVMAATLDQTFYAGYVDEAQYDETSYNEPSYDQTSYGEPVIPETGTPETGTPEPGTSETATFEALTEDAPATPAPATDENEDWDGDENEDGARAHEPAATPAPTATPRPSRARARNANSRRRTAKRSALLTVAVPSVCVMGVAAVAAAAVVVPDSGNKHSGSKTQADGAHTGNKLDQQLTNLTADAGDFADRASRTQERLDLKQRQAEEKKRKAEEAARKEALRPKFVLPVTQHGLSAYFGQAGVNWMALHTGIDFPVSIGTSVHAVTDGTVTTKWNSAYGNMAILTAPDGTVTWYCHLSSVRIRSGTVKAGDVIAYSGNTGNSTGPHLHFEVHPHGGAAIDPLPWLLSKGLDPR
jgi:murein DD-endopeptidase MepM/ murein hydrolase activator NlpD